MKIELSSSAASGHTNNARLTAGVGVRDAAVHERVQADQSIPLGTKLRDLRKQLRQSQTQFAEALGCSKRTLLTYETLRREPPFRVIREAARLGDLSIDEFALDAEAAGRYRVRAWQQAEALKQRLIELAILKGVSLDMDSDRWNRVMEILLVNGAHIGPDVRLLEIFLILQTSDKPSAPTTV